jgi:hypothetical protein
MKNKRAIILSITLAALACGWWAFRPERLFLNDTVNEGFPSATAASDEARPQALLGGMFRGLAHETSGSVTLYQLPGVGRTLRLADFKTSNGPDVHVYLVAANDAADDETVTKAGFVDLGSLKGNIGDQNYDIPADLDLAKYRAVTIWCKRFGVNFGTAALKNAPNDRNS